MTVMGRNVESELLEPGSIYTVGRLAVACIRHEPGERPHLKLMPYPAHFVENVAKAAALMKLGRSS